MIHKVALLIDLPNIFKSLRVGAGHEIKRVISIFVLTQSTESSLDRLAISVL